MGANIITTAIAKDSSPTPIEKAITGERYRGIAHHEQCLLYPVHRQGRRSSFAHMPNRQDCRPPGESEEHKTVKEAWHKFLWSELTAAKFWSRAPMFGDITWTCRECFRPHVFEPLAGAVDVVLEKRLANGLRPDLTTVGPDGEPVVLIEFKKTNVSERVRQFASESGVPLFVIDILDGESEQATLDNRQRRWYDAIPEFDEESRRMARAVECFPATVFEPFYNSHGDLVDAFLTYHDDDPEQVLPLFGIPKPRRGHLLFAHESTLGCDSQRPERMPWLFPEAAAS